MRVAGSSCELSGHGASKSHRHIAFAAGVTPLMLLPRCPAQSQLCKPLMCLAFPVHPAAVGNLLQYPRLTSLRSHCSLQLLLPSSQLIAGPSSLFKRVSSSLDRPLLCGGRLNASEGILGPAWQCWTHGRENSNINGKFCGKSHVRLFDLVRNQVQRGPDPRSRTENH